MKRAFGDTYYFLALLNPRDQQHARVRDFGPRWTGVITTTRWVLAELADGLCDPPLRAVASAFLLRMEENPFVRVIPVDETQYLRGLDLFRRRADKEWSLTDCISFVVMADEGIDDALTGDRHFEQAGFRALFT